MVNGRIKRTIGEAEIIKTRGKKIDMSWVSRKHKSKVCM